MSHYVSNPFQVLGKSDKEDTAPVENSSASVASVASVEQEAPNQDEKESLTVLNFIGKIFASLKGTKTK